MPGRSTHWYMLAVNAWCILGVKPWYIIVRKLTTYAEQRLDKLGVVILDRGDDWALVLVEAQQMEDLARLGFRPQSTDDLGTLVAAHAEDVPDLAASLQPVLDRAAQTYAMRDAGVASLASVEADLSAEMNAITEAQQAAVAGLLAVDDDGDGLTNTEEAWWCTDPLDANSDGDAQGYTDGEEVAALLDFTLPRSVRWGYGAPFGPPNAWPDFNGADGDPATPACNDGDYDTIPDYAEVYMVGSRVPEESTDRDKFDDGQELFGVTYCPGAPTSCGYGSYPRIEYWNYIQAAMPSWVRAPGDNVFVAAFPEPEVSITPGSWHVERVTTITTEQGEMMQTEHSYQTSATRGQGTSIADTVTWNEWEEVSEAVEELVDVTYQRSTIMVEPVTALTIWTLVFSGIGAGAATSSAISDQRQTKQMLNDTTGQDVVQQLVKMNEYNSQLVDGLSTSSDRLQALDATLDDELTGIGTSLGSGFREMSTALGDGLMGVSSSLDGIHYAINRQGQLMARGLYDISYAISQPRRTETRAKGRSWGGAQTTTHEVYEEHTIAEGETFTTGEQWSTAWAVDSSHAADLTFEFTVANTGTEYAREVTGMIVNVYIGDDTSPSISYPAWEKFPGGTIQNLFPGTSHTFVTNPIPLTLEQMKRIDLGERLTVVVEDYSFGADELFYQNAVQGGVTVYIEDGIEDGDESVDHYVIPTWGVESVQDVLTRYFPAGYDEDGNLNALWTPEFDGTNPPTWHEHYLSDIAWWNVYLTQAEEGSTPLQNLQAQADSAILFRFNRDSDRDGYNDRAEFRYYCSLPSTHSDAGHCTDGHLLPEVHPRPEVLAGYVAERQGDVVTVKLAVENTGTFDAYGIDAVMYAPDDTLTIGNNTVGGNGRARPGEHVAVGSLIKAPDLSQWGSNTAKPYAGGSYIGTTDKVYTFTVTTPGVVGQSSTALGWTDSLGGSGTLDVGTSYHAPLPMDVADGVQVGLNTGSVLAGTSFTLQALTPRDTFTYTINTEPYTEPVIVVSYSDPQGSHRFVTPVAMADLSESLAVHSGTMLEGLALQIVTTEPVTASVPNETHFVIHSPDGRTIQDGHLYLNFVADGQLVAELPYTLTVPTGPTVQTVSWSTDVFSQTYDPVADNILIAFWTDGEGNIIDAAARPLSTFQEDPAPVLAMVEEELVWDFGTVPQGTVLKHTFAAANTGLGDLLTYVSAPEGVTLSRVGSRSVDTADASMYDVTLDTLGLPLGPYSETITVRTSDPQRSSQMIHLTGSIIDGTVDTPPGALARPLDWDANISGSHSQGEWVNFSHTLGPDMQTLHPVRVYSHDYSTLWGMGRYAADFGQNTTSYEMFGHGGDGDLLVGTGQTIYVDSVRTRLSSTSLASQKNLYVASTSGFAVGDEVLVIQTQGTGVGNYEFVTVAALSGAVLTIEDNLNNTYSVGGSSKAQAIRVPNYRNVTVQSGGLLTSRAWDGATGGIVAFRAKGTLTVQSAGTIDVSGTGFDGGETVCFNHAYQGDSATADGTISIAANGTGGGGGHQGNGAGAGSGGGGGLGTAGANGGGGARPGGAGGTTGGNTELTNLTFGGGGGGGGTRDACATPGGRGGDSGGIAFIAARDIVLENNSFIKSNGKNGSDRAGPDSSGGGGGGAGGSILLRAGTVAVSSSRVVAVGGTGGVGGGTVGGAGGLGRIRIEYCESLTGSTNPPASTQKLDCYIAEQVETTPYNQGNLNLPESFADGRHYWIQYARRHVFPAAGTWDTVLRVPAGALDQVRLDALISDILSGDTTLKMDIGIDGTWDWQVSQNIDGTATLSSPNLHGAFGSYWSAQGAPTAGDLDAPIRIYLSKPGQVLLTNLQIVPSGSVPRHVQLAGIDYTELSLDVEVGQSGSGDLVLAADVGDDGVIDGTYSASVAFPARITTSDLSAAFNAYLDAHSGMVNVPVRFHIAPFSSAQIVDFTAVPTLLPDVAITTGDIVFGVASPTEGATVPVTVTVHNEGPGNSGPLTAAFFAALPEWGEWYIGSTLVAGVPAGGMAQGVIQWNTLGFTGTVPVRVELDPYDRLSESSESNNEASVTYGILTRPDLYATDVAFSDPEPMAGETVTITLFLHNAGETTASGISIGFEIDDTQVEQSGPVILDGGSETPVPFTWTPAQPGPYRLRWVSDSTDAVDEYDEGNNATWRDVYVGHPSPLLLDSGVLANDPAYTTTTGYGVVDLGQPDVLSVCGSGAQPYETLRRDPDGDVHYRFDHLLPGHFYHLDITLYECDGAGRQESVYVDGMLVAGPEDLGDGEVHQLSVRLDPALYRYDHGIDILISAPGFDGALVSEVNLYDIDYRYADAGGTSDEAHASSTAELSYGWLDGSVSTAAGTLPYQSVRVDQTDNEVRYRFDSLDADKRYNVHFTFWQPSGTARIQRVRIDGLDTGLTVDTGDFQVHKETVAVPPGAYTDDGNLIVSVVRLNAASGAMVNEIALEEETRTPVGVCQVAETPQFTDVYGGIWVLDQPAPVGTVVKAYNPRGDIVGCYVVTTPGDYGFMRVYGEDATAVPPIPGMRPGELVEFRVSGALATATPLLYWQNDHGQHAVDLNAGVIDGQLIGLNTGWNLISFYQQPPVPSVPRVLTYLDGLYDRVLGEDGVYVPSLPDYSTLPELGAGEGYYLRLSIATSVDAYIEGVPLPVTSPLTLHVGWNWIGYLPRVTLPITEAMQSIDGHYLRVLNLNQAYDVNLPEYSTLKFLEPGKGYLIYITYPVTLVYPDTGAGATGQVESQAAVEACEGMAPTPFLSLVYGAVTVNGDPAPVGARVEVVTPRGEIAGCAVVETPGLLPLTHVYGRDAETEPPIPGFEAKEPLVFWVNGLPAEADVSLNWEPDRTPHEVILSSRVQNVYLPSVLRSR